MPPEGSAASIFGVRGDRVARVQTDALERLSWKGVTSAVGFRRRIADGEERRDVAARDRGGAAAAIARDGRGMEPETSTATRTRPAKAGTFSIGDLERVLERVTRPPRGRVVAAAFQAASIWYG